MQIHESDAISVQIRIEPMKAIRMLKSMICAALQQQRE
jgi:hypothetical protein